VGTYTAVVTAQNAVNVLTATTNVLIFNQYKNFLPTVMYEVCSPSALPVDVILAMDTSGSMGAMTDDGTQTKLDAAKSAASSFIDLLDFPSDQAGIVSFSDNAYLNAPLTVDEADLKNTLSLLTADGATRIDLAIDVSRAELVGTRHRPDSRQVLILLSDGHPTETTVEAVLDMANTAKASGIIIYTIGLAQDVNESLMQNIASSPQNYYFAPSTEDLTTIYEQIADVIRCP
jgi:Ca-activated chloride channel family protein